MNYKLKKISSDASFREFYRLKKGNKTSIIVKANKEKFRNLPKADSCAEQKIWTVVEED